MTPTPPSVSNRTADAGTIRKAYRKRAKDTRVGKILMPNDLQQQFNIGGLGQ